MNIQTKYNRTEPHNYRCKVCLSWFGLFDFFVKHMETDSHSYSCQQCGLMFVQAYLRRRHIEKNHPEVANICEICELKVSNYEAVWRHHSIHNISYECLKCHRWFVRKELLLLHSEVHLPPTPCPWEGCNRKLATKIGLFNHLRMHKGERDFICNICKKGFFKKTALVSHMKIHCDRPALKKNSSRGRKRSLYGMGRSVYLNMNQQVTGIQFQSAEDFIDSNPQVMYQYQCSGCNNLFESENHFQAHICTGHSNQGQVILPTNQTVLRPVLGVNDRDAVSINIPEFQSSSRPSVLPEETAAIFDQDMNFNSMMTIHQLIGDVEQISSQEIQGGGMCSAEQGNESVLIHKECKENFTIQETSGCFLDHAKGRKSSEQSIFDIGCNNQQVPPSAADDLPVENQSSLYLQNEHIQSDAAEEFWAQISFGRHENNTDSKNKHTENEILLKQKMEFEDSKENYAPNAQTVQQIQQSEKSSDLQLSEMTLTFCAGCLNAFESQDHFQAHICTGQSYQGQPVFAINEEGAVSVSIPEVPDSTYMCVLPEETATVFTQDVNSYHQECPSVN